MIGQGQQAAYSADFQRHHLWDPGQVARHATIWCPFKSAYTKSCKWCKVILLYLHLFNLWNVWTGSCTRHGIHGMEDIIHEIYTVGPKFKEVECCGHFSVRFFHCFLHRCHGSQVSNFLWPFKLSSPKGGFINKRFKLSPSVFLPNSASQRSSARKIWLRPRFLWSSWWWLGQPWGAHQRSPKAHELSSWMKRTWDLASRQKKGKGSCGFWFWGCDPEDEDDRCWRIKNILQ